MSSQNNNPFSLPGFGQTGESSGNPLLASMQMMGQAWQNLAGSGMLNQPPVSAALTTEDLDRRINDLRAVENWLRINMSMLTSSIQALEVQRATIATLKSFVNVPGASVDKGDNPSPLEMALGIKPSGQAKIKTPEAAREPTAQPDSAASGTSDEAGSGQANPLQADTAALSDAAQGWWNMLQKQFDTLAAATVAGMQTGQQNPSAATDSTAKRTPSARKTSGRQAGAAAKKPAASTKTPAAAKRKSVKTAGAAPARKRVVGSTRAS